MKDEIAAAVFFITKLVKREGKLSKDEIEKFAEKLTTILFEKYKNHWHPGNPCRGQAFSGVFAAVVTVRLARITDAVPAPGALCSRRCIRINKQQPREPLLEQACADSGLDSSLLGLPKEVTVWVDPLEVSCRYGERNQPFSVARFDGRENPELPQHISLAVAKAALDYDSGTSSDEESFSREPRAIPTVSNPNSIYQAPPLPWWQYQHRKPHLAEGSHFGQHRGYRGYGPGATPCVDRYHWINPKK
ncbi:PREDICTED: protein BTG4 isoform X1 [Ficedula albicollis]|uniref:protein BTG4 isoform X1 n=1 Tax=Ficedula albicollis TaxID=59894 RepID=UPI000359B6AB|nr:PREDICTED: protein BTG4 isoform X1 [Ficedula albicollis]XP_005058851.1 PREDICTED: protein BTG4 isoform X1 [Ficedula albicollis]